MADVMLGGTAILATIMRYFRFDECLVSEADLLDGLVLSLLDGTWTRPDSSRAAPLVGIDRNGRQWPTAHLPEPM